MKNTLGYNLWAGSALLLAILWLPASGCSRGGEEKPAPDYSPAEREKSPESVLEQALKESKANPGNAKTLYHLADIYDRQGQYRKSVELFAQVVALQPENGYAYLKLGTGYSQLEQAEKAVEALLQAVRYLPELPLAYNNLAIACGKLERLEEEITYLQKALQLRPRYGSARYNLGMTYLKKGELAAARQEYEILREYEVKLGAELLKAIESRK